jgi:gamma-glutamyltranspeptidase/glutathione hydrolase
VENVLAHADRDAAVAAEGWTSFLIHRLDFGRPLLDAVAAPRASQRNTPTVSAEPAFNEDPLEALGHTLVDVAEIGAVTAIEQRDDGQLVAVAEPVRRGGGDAGVVLPKP